MVPAMEREARTQWRQIWIILSLGIFLGAVCSGCAEIKSQIFGDQKIGELGHVEDPSEVYARNTPRTLMAPPNQIQATVTAPGSMLTEVEEAGPAVLPAGTGIAGTTNPEGVALQLPRAIDSGSGVKLASASAGVPNAARILAASEPKSEIKPEVIVEQARTALETMTSYELSMHRQERVNGSLLPEEDVTLALRRSPRAILLSWPSGPNQGREVLFRADEPGGQIHIKLANPALPRLSLDPMSPAVMKNSRHPITEAGLDSLVEGLENGVQTSTIQYAGIETPTGLDRPAHCLTRTGPGGEVWRAYLDVESHLPVMIQAVDSRGELLERHVFHDLKPNPAELAANDAFDPIARWGQPRGLLSRLTRGMTENTTPATESTPR
jgi:hypothetical protein